MKNEKSIVEKNEKTALERWENEGGEILGVPEIETNDRVILIGETLSPIVADQKDAVME